MNYLRAVKNNWKKSAFGSALLGYGIYSLQSYYAITNHMTKVCNEVANNADLQKGFPKRVLVIMNPVANKKKGEKMFKKYCEPVLHLAGYSVEIVKTDHVGHAKSLIENMKILPDAIVVAGGDGTTSEVVTGLMRRNDETCPIVLLPLGCRNETALKYANLQPSSKLDFVKSLTNCIMPMINEKYRSESVIKFDVLDSNNSNTDHKSLKPIYGLNRFSWGLLRDIESVKDKYWYFGFLRHHAAAVFNSFSNKLNWKFSTNFIYTPPCPGCRNCLVERERNVSSKFYLHKLLPKKSTNSAEGAKKPLTSNANCTEQIEGNVETNQLNISCHRNDEAFSELETKFINSIKPGFDFIKNISSAIHNDIEPSLILKSRTIQLFPSATDANNTFYSIDGEEYDARPIQVAVVPNAIKLFC